MVRNFDLIRKILKELQELPAGKAVQSFEYLEYEERTIQEHIELLFEANLIKGQYIETLQGADHFLIERLTWE